MSVRPPSIRFFLSALIAALCLLAVPSAEAQQKVGVNAAVNADAHGTPPGAPVRRLVIGQEVVHNEHITTDAKGQTQILFLDGSSVSVGPNADLIIDEFVYDPATGTGKMTLTAVRGAMRFVGGKLSKQDNAVTLHLGTATIGVRGGVFVANVQPGGAAEIIFVYGKEVKVSGRSGCAQTLYRPGYEVTIGAPGACPGSPQQAPPGAAAAIMAQLDGRAGATGGAKTVPTNATVANSGISNTVSNNVAVSIAQANSNAPFVPTVPAPTVSPPQVPVNQIQTATTQQAIPPQTQPLPPVPSFAGSFDFPSGIGNTFTPIVVPLQNPTLANDTLNTTVEGLGDLALPLPKGYTVLPSAGVNAGGNAGPLTGDTFLSGDQSFFYANLMSASFFANQSASGSAAATQFLEPSLLVGGTPAPSSVFAATDSTRILAFDLPRPAQAISDFSLVNTLPFFLNDEGLTDANPSISPLYIVAPANTAIGSVGPSGPARVLQASLSITGTGAQQNSALLVTVGTVSAQQGGQPIITGAMQGTNLGELYFGAVSSIPDANGNSFYGTAKGIAGFGLSSQQYTLDTSGVATKGTESQASETEGLSLNPQFNLDKYAFAQPAVASGGTGAPPSGVGSSRTTQVQFGFLGGVMTTTATTPLPNFFSNSGVGGHAYPVLGIGAIATDATANTVTATMLGVTDSSLSGGINTLVMNFGPEKSAFVDDRNFGAHESTSVSSQIDNQNVNAKLYMVTANTAPPPGTFLPNQSICSSCAFLQWGYWGGELTTGNPNSPNRIDHGDINFWVSGQLTPVNQMPTVGTGTYSGAAVGSVVNSGATYLASGGFTNTYNFGNNTGTVAISNFDGNNLTGAVTAGTGNGTPIYAGPIAGGNKQGAVIGAFYGPNAAETGGSFGFQSVSGAPYIASGVFAGKLTGPVH